MEKIWKCKTHKPHIYYMHQVDIIDLNKSKERLTEILS